MWNVIKRHPLIAISASLFIVLPVFFLSAIAVGNNLPACRRWKIAVDKAALERIGTLYVGGGDREKVDDAYRNGDSSYDEILAQLKEKARHDMDESRPPLCL